MEEGSEANKPNYPSDFIDEQIEKGRAGNNQQETGKPKLPQQLIEKIVALGKVKPDEVIPDKSTPSPKAK